MIEINRALYMDEASGERLPDFPHLQAIMERVLRGIIGCCARAVAGAQ